ncbi:MAG: hypothetical protein P1U85_21205 [Verrucomicrobiales bacterium]|nr:hypothetical protein [Verrucomicrobiales bacterium]
MALANKIKTHQYDPLYFNQQRCEFRLDPNKVYLSNMRLADIGCTVVYPAGATANAEYPYNVGGYVLIQRISLLNDNVEIAELNNVADWMGFSNLQRSNANAYNITRSLNKSKLGFDLDDKNGTTYERNIHIKDITENQNYITSDGDTTPRGWLDIKTVLPFLQASKVLNTKEMRNLRLVIEFSSMPLGDMFVGTTPTSKSILRPSLIVDELIEIQGKLPNGPINYINYDSERVVVNSMGSNTTQDVNQRLRGFDNKTINRLLFINKDNNNNSKYMKKFYSSGMFQEQFQFILDGQKFLPYQGINSEAKKNEMCSSAWGGHINPYGCHTYTLDGISNTLKEGNDLGNKFSYGGINIQKEVDELQLEYERRAYTEIPTQVSNVIVGNTTTITAINHGLVSGDFITIANLTGSDATQLSGPQVVNSITDSDNFVINQNTTSNVITTQSTTTLSTANNSVRQQVSDSKKPFDLLFWGEVVKSLQASDNKVSVSF